MKLKIFGPSTKDKIAQLFLEIKKFQEELEKKSDENLNRIVDSLGRDAEERTARVEQSIQAVSTQLGRDAEERTARVEQSIQAVSTQLGRDAEERTARVEQSIQAVSTQLGRDAEERTARVEQSIQAVSTQLGRDAEERTARVEQSIQAVSTQLGRDAEERTARVEQSIQAVSTQLGRDAEERTARVEQSIQAVSEGISPTLQALSKKIDDVETKFIREVGVQKENIEKLFSDSNLAIIREIGAQKEHLESMIVASNKALIENIGIQKHNIERAIINLHEDFKKSIDDLFNPDLIDYISNEKKILVKKNEKIRIYFLFQVPSFWPSIHTLWVACLKDPQIETRVLLYAPADLSNPQFQGAREFLEERGIPFDDASEMGFAHPLPHVLIYQSPYDDSHRSQAFWVDRIKMKGVRPVYITYGTEISASRQGIRDQFKLKSIQCFWRIYTYSNEMVRQYRLHASTLVDNVVGIGHPKLDLIRDGVASPLNEKIKNKIARRNVFLWKIHFAKNAFDGSIEKDVQVTPNLETYIKFCETIKKYKNFFFLVLIHPFSEAAHSSADKDKFVALRKALNQLENACICDDMDYRACFIIADAFITDITGTMVEMSIVNKPVLYLTGVDFEEALTPPALEITKGFVKGKSLDDMEKFIINFQSGVDDLKAQRELTVRKQIRLSKEKSFGELIRDDIKRALKLDL